MTWMKVDDQLAFHSKTMLAGNAAMGLWVRAGSWASATLTDGFVPTHMALAMGTPDEVQQLISAGFWNDVEGGYSFHDWSEFQPSAENEKRLRKERSEAGKAGAKARWANRDTSKPDGKSHGKTTDSDGNRHSKSHSKPMADPMANGWQTDAPSRPVPSQSLLRSDEGATPSPRPRATRLPDGWIPTPELRAAMTSECPDVDLALEHRKFTDHWKSQPGTKGTKLDWDATWRNWIRRSSKNGGRKQTAQQRITQSRALVEHPELDTANYDNTNPW